MFYGLVIPVQDAVNQRHSFPFASITTAGAQVWWVCENIAARVPPRRGWLAQSALCTHVRWICVVNNASQLGRHAKQHARCELRSVWKLWHSLPWMKSTSPLPIFSRVAILFSFCHGIEAKNISVSLIYFEKAQAPWGHRCPGTWE